MPPPARTMPAPFPAEGQHTDAAYAGAAGPEGRFFTCSPNCGGRRKKAAGGSSSRSLSLTYFAATDLMTLTSRPL